MSDRADDLLVHGGGIGLAVKKYGVSREQWQDLSTGISPWSWPVPEKIPAWVWSRLPEEEALIAAASEYYGCLDKISACIPVAGSQLAIRTIPKLLTPSQVAIPAVGYQEHRHSWRLAGHDIIEYQTFAQLVSLARSSLVKHAVVINPNNPTTERYSADSLQYLAGLLAAQQINSESSKDSSLLLVDEAFSDCIAARSDLLLKAIPNVVVLRSIGKFFGLAGLRLGFALGSSDLLRALHNEISPWGVSSLAVYLGCLALRDVEWQRQQRRRIQHASDLLYDVCQRRFPNCDVRNGRLFISIFGESVMLREVHINAAVEGILLRYEEVFSGQAWLRIGLSADIFFRLRNHWSV